MVEEPAPPPATSAAAPGRLDGAHASVHAVVRAGADAAVHAVLRAGASPKLLPAGAAQSGERGAARLPEAITRLDEDALRFLLQNQAPIRLALRGR